MAFSISEILATLPAKYGLIELRMEIVKVMWSFEDRNDIRHLPPPSIRCLGRSQNLFRRSDATEQHLTKLQNQVMDYSDQA